MLVSEIDAVVIYDRITRLPPVRFIDRHLHLPCIVFRVRGLSVSSSQSDKKEAETVYRAKVIGLGKVDIVTADTLPLKEPERLVLAHPWIHDVRGSHGGTEEDSDSDLASFGVDTDSDEADSDSDAGADVFSESELVPASLVNVTSSVSGSGSSSLGTYARASQLIARLGDPFTALVFLQQQGGVYKRLATEHEIVVQGMMNNLKVVQTTVLAVL